jgi:hypothetical protein
MFVGRRLNQNMQILKMNLHLANCNHRPIEVTTRSGLSFSIGKTHHFAATLPRGWREVRPA